jgi:hypothetical protein
VDLARWIERKCGGGVNDHVAATRGAQDVVANANVAAHLDDAVVLGVVERLAIE